jgi:type VI secretion system protein ImpA
MPVVRGDRGGLQDSSVEDVQKTAAELGRALESIAGIEKSFSTHVGAARGGSLSDLTGVIKGAHQTVSEQLAKKAPQTVDEAGGVVAAEAGAPAQASGVIRTRDDVLKTLDKLCDYFDRNEPSSPVPILLRRAKRLINKSFMDIVRDMASNGVSQVELLRGSEE